MSFAIPLRQLRRAVIPAYLRNILDMAIPCSGDSEVKIDGFKLIDNKSLIPRLYDTQLSEQEITLRPVKPNLLSSIQKQLGSLLDLIDSENNGKTVKIDDFRLKDLSSWLEDTPCDPADMLGYIATRCQLIYNIF